MRFARHFAPARLVAARDLSPTVRLFEIEPEGGAQPWTPGAHIAVSLPLESGVETRHYSLVGAPQPDRYTIAVKRDDSGRGGSRYLHRCAEGARLSISEPHNDFALSWRPAPTVLVAGGIGVTPVVAMAQQLAARGADVSLLYAARTRDELIFADEFRAALNDRARFFVSADGARMNVAAEVAAMPADAEVYLCGPLALVDEFRRVWRDQGRAPSLLRTETFASGGAHPAEAFRVRAPALGVDIVVPADRSMVDALEAAGVEVMTDCRRGECGLCAVDVLSCDGEIDHRDVYLSEHEKAEGKRICACVSRVVGGSIVIDTGFVADH